MGPRCFWFVRLIQSPQKTPGSLPLPHRWSCAGETLGNSCLRSGEEDSPIRCCPPALLEWLFHHKPLQFPNRGGKRGSTPAASAFSAPTDSNCPDHPHVGPLPHMSIDPGEPLKLCPSYALGSFVPGLVLILSCLAVGAFWTYPGAILVILNLSDDHWTVDWACCCCGISFAHLVWVLWACVPPFRMLSLPALLPLLAPRLLPFVGQPHSCYMLALADSSGLQETAAEDLPEQAAASKISSRAFLCVVWLVIWVSLPLLCSSGSGWCMLSS